MPTTAYPIVGKPWPKVKATTF